MGKYWEVKLLKTRKCILMLEFKIQNSGGQMVSDSQTYIYSMLILYILNRLSNKKLYIMA